MAAGAGNSRRFFTTTGPVKPDRHYCIPPLDRLDLDHVLALLRDEKYFVLRAPRQTGKTSALLALRDRLNADGYRCVYANVEVAQTARDLPLARCRYGRSGSLLDPGELRPAT